MGFDTKTINIIELIKILSVRKNYGINIKSIMDEFQVSYKTTKRYIDSLKDAFPDLVEYNKNTKILKGVFPDFKTNDVLKIKNDINHELCSKINIFNSINNNNQDNNHLLKIDESSGINVSNDEVLLVLNKIIKPGVLIIKYHKKEHTGYPLFFCFSPPFWYLFFMYSENDFIVKFRLNKIDSVRAFLLLKSNKIVPDKFYKKKIEVINTLKNSKNIYVDFQSVNKQIFLELRFYVDIIDYFSSFDNVKIIKINDDNNDFYVDFSIDFQGYFEAYFFLVRWLGKFKILKPDDFRYRFKKDIFKGSRLL